jgi:hypothetical protein
MSTSSLNALFFIFIKLEIVVSAVCPGWLALFSESIHSFFLIFGGKGALENPSLKKKTLR